MTDAWQAAKLRTPVEILWRIELLGRLRAEPPGRVVTRFRSQRTGLVLAYLAYYSHRAHAREALIELLWPEYPPETGRASLSTAFSALRRDLEQPASGARGPVPVLLRRGCGQMMWLVAYDDEDPDEEGNEEFGSKSCRETPEGGLNASR